MIRRQPIFATGVFLVLALQAVFAQDDSVLQRYDLAIENLQVATASVPQDGAQARDELERALNALLTLSRDATSTNLVQAMERTFERTRVAVDNQSRTDMAVQTAVLAGGFSRLVMDSAYLAASAGDLELAKGRLGHLASRAGFTQADQAAIVAATSAGQLRLAFEAGTADAIVAELRAADALRTTDADAAYVSLARAYGESLMVQDSPRVDLALNRNLVAAAQALVNQDEDGLAAATQAAKASLGKLAAAARGDSAAAASEGGTQASDATAQLTDAPAPEELPAASNAAAPEHAVVETPAAEPGPAVATPDAATPDAAVTEAPASAAAAVAASAAADAATPRAETSPVVVEPGLAEAVAERIAQLNEEAAQLRAAHLTTELVTAGLPSQAAASAATRLAANGHSDLAGLLGQLEVQAARVVAGVNRGEQASAAAALAQLDASYREDVAPLLAQVAPDLSRSTSELLTSLHGRASLTPADAGLLAARAELVRGAFTGQRPTAGDELEAGVATVWSGTTRSIVFLILGILAVFPLVLLNMAFGGSNRNWRLVGVALFLLLVPVFYQAVVGLTDLLGAYVDMSWLPDLGRWSIFGGFTGQVAWAALVLVALVLAAGGLRGICVQFGLLGGGKKAGQAPAAAASAKGTGHTTIDWDEEY